MSSIINYLTGIFYNSQTSEAQKPVSLGRVNLSLQYDAGTVDLVLGDRVWESMPEAESDEAFQRIEWLYQEKSQIAPELQAAFLEMVARGGSAALPTFEAFQQGVQQSKALLSLEWLKSDFQRLSAAAHLSEEQRDLIVNEINARLTNFNKFTEGLSKIAHADPGLLQKILERYFSIYLLGLEMPSDAVFQQIQWIHDQLVQSGAAASYLKELFFGTEIQPPQFLPPDAASINVRKLHLDSFLRKLEEADSLGKYQFKIKREQALLAQYMGAAPEQVPDWKGALTPQDQTVIPNSHAGAAQKSAELNALETGPIQSQIDVLKRDGAVLLLGLPEMTLPQKPAPAAEEGFLVQPLGNVLFKKTFGGVEFEPSGKWAIVDISEANPADAAQIRSLLSPKFLKTCLADKAPYIPVCFHFEAGRLTEDPNGQVRILYESPAQVFAAQEKRAHGQKTFLVRDASTNQYRRASIDINAPQLNPTDQLLLDVDRLEAIAMSRKIALAAASPEETPIDPNHLQRFADYFTKARANLDMLYSHDPILSQADMSFAMLKEAISRQLIEQGSSLQGMEGDMQRLRAAMLLPPAQREAISKGINDRFSNRFAFEQQLRARFPDANQELLEHVASTYFSMHRFGFAQATEETFLHFNAVYQTMLHRLATTPGNISLLQLDAPRSPTLLPEGISANLKREIQVDAYFQKLKEVDRYQRYLCELRSEKDLLEQFQSTTPGQMKIWKEQLSAKDQALLPSSLEAAQRRAVELENLERVVIQEKLNSLSDQARQKLVSFPDPEPVQPLPQAPASASPVYVFPVGNVLLRESMGGVEFEPQGQWAVVDMMDAPQELRDQALPLLTADWIKQNLPNDPYTPACFQLVDGQLTQAPDGPIRLFFEMPENVFASHENRDLAQITRISRNPDTGLYGRTVVDAEREEAGKLLTAEIDRLEMTWINRILALQILSGNGEQIDWRNLQRIMEYRDGVNTNDRAKKYFRDETYVQSDRLYGSVEQSLIKQIHERAALELVEAHQEKGHLKNNVKEGLQRIGEMAQFYRNWVKEIDDFLKIVPDSPKLNMRLSWFIDRLKEVRPFIDDFANRLPSAEEINACATDFEREQLIRNTLPLFQRPFRVFDELRAALYRLQAAEKSAKVKGLRSQLFEARLTRETGHYLEDPAAHIRKRYLELHHKVPDAKILKDVGRMVQQKYVELFGDQPPAPGLLELLSRVIRQEGQFGPEYTAAAVASLCDLDRLQKSASNAFPNVFQTASRAELCFKELHSAVSALTPLHFEIMETFASVQESVKETEKLRSSERGKQMAQMKTDEQVLDFYFPDLDKKPVSS